MLVCEFHEDRIRFVSYRAEHSFLSLSLACILAVGTNLMGSSSKAGCLSDKRLSDSESAWPHCVWTWVWWSLVRDFCTCFRGGDSETISETKPRVALKPMPFERGPLKTSSQAFWHTYHVKKYIWETEIAFRLYGFPGWDLLLTLAPERNIV